MQSGGNTGNVRDADRGPDQCGLVVDSGRRDSAGPDADCTWDPGYAEQKCAVCHSIGGKGKQKGALDLSIEDVEALVA